MTSPQVVTAQLTLTEPQRRFAIALIAHDGEIRHAARQAAVSDPEALLQMPMMQTYLEHLKMRLTEIQDSEEPELKKGLMSREDVARFLQSIIEDPERSDNARLQASRLYLDSFKPASAERRQVLTVREVEKQMEAV